MAARPPGWAFAVLLLAAAAPVGQSPPPPPAALESARAEEQRLGQASVDAAARLRTAETALDDAAETVARLADQRREAEQRLNERAAALAPLLPLAERLGLFPAETLLAVPAPPEQAIRGLTVLHGLMHTLERQAADLRQQVAAVDAAQRALDAALPALRQAQQMQALQSAQLDRQLESARALRSRLEDAAAEQARRAATDASHADSVRAALDAMAASRARTDQVLQQDADRASRQHRAEALETTRRRQAEIAAPAGPGMRPGGGAIFPISGPIVRHWGEQTDAGPATGLAVRTPPRGRVVAPCAGRVVFAQPFRSYGMLIILDCGGGYHFVLAGLGRLDTGAGDQVEQGEPVGIMPDWDPTTPTPRPSLYVELRHNGSPVDPSPFLRQGS